jgi:hypothetical protein
MPIHDWFVGGVSIMIGSVLAIAAASNSAKFFEFAKPRLLAEAIGRGQARLFFVCIGLFFVVLGIAIVSGYRIAT